MDSNSQLPDGFYLRTLGSGERDKIFENANAKILVEDARAHEILARLRELDPDVGAKFKIRHDSFADAPFRLLFRKSRETPENSREVKSFIALSYCWHSGDWEVAAPAPTPNVGNHVPTHGSSAPTSHHMFQAVCDQLNSDNEGLWIDQLCIDQSNPIEVSAAVAAAHLVYKSARQVVVAIEDVMLDENEVEAVETVVKERAAFLANNKAMVQPTFIRHLTDTPATRSALRKICTARWFKRAWCYYEQCLAKDIVFRISGPSGVVAAELSLLRTLLYHSGVPTYITTAPSSSTVMPEISAAFYALHNSELYGAQLLKPGDVLHSMLTLEARFPSDILNIALYLAATDLSYTGHVTDKDSICLLYNFVLIAANNCSPFFHLGPNLRLEQSKTHSWMNAPVPRVSGTDLTLPSLFSFIKFSFEELYVDLLLIRGNPRRRPAPLAFEKVKTFMETAQFEDFCRDVEKTWGNIPDSSGLQKFRRGLATAVDCGVSCMVRCWQQYLTVFPAAHGSFISADSELPMELMDVLFPDATASLHCTKAVRQQVASFIAMLMLGETLLSVDYWALIVGAEDECGLFHSLSIDENEDPILAVPSMFHTEDFAFTERLWQLVSVTSTNGPAWRVVEKRQLLGAPVLKHDDQHVILMKNQRIIGGS
jgi:hypothetical protein